MEVSLLRSELGVADIVIFFGQHAVEAGGVRESEWSHMVGAVSDV